jgi:3',5'-cyclic-AMP phosphodiesterase
MSAKKEVNIMRFVVLGDLHYAEYTQPEHAAARDRLFTAFFSQIAKLQPDFVFAVGDTTNYGTFDEVSGLAGIVSACGVPLICITGNHDCYSMPKTELAPYFLGGQVSHSPSELYTAIDSGLARFILLDTARDRDYDRYDGYVSPEQLEWLNGKIVQFNQLTTPRYLVAMGHHPIYNTTRRSEETMLNIENSSEVRAAFAKLERKPGFYFCGHNHCNSISEMDEVGWYHVQTADPLDSKSFRLVILSEDKVEIETLDFDLSDRNLYEDYKLARFNIPAHFTPNPYERAQGELHERSLSLSI